MRGPGGGSSSRSEKGRRKKKACSQRMFPNPAGLLPRHHLLPAPLLPLRPHSHRRQRGKTAEDHQRGTGEQISRTRGGSRKAAPLPHMALLETLLMLHPQVGEAHSRSKDLWGAANQTASSRTGVKAESGRRQPAASHPNERAEARAL